MNPGPFTPSEIAEIAASARDHVDTITPDICPDMSRAEIGQLVVAVGLAMAAETLRNSADLDREHRLRIADALEQAARELGVPA